MEGAVTPRAAPRRSVRSVEEVLLPRHRQHAGALGSGTRVGVADDERFELREAAGELEQAAQVRHLELSHLHLDDPRPAASLEHRIDLVRLLPPVVDLLAGVPGVG